MATLESQYKSYRRENHKSNLTFEQWKKQILEPMLKNAIKQINTIDDEKTWFTADLHLAHNNISNPNTTRWKSGFRDFKDLAEHDMTIIDNINKYVEEDHVLYILGDFCLGDKSNVTKYRRFIKCKKVYFIIGNHDKHISIAGFWKGLSPSTAFSLVDKQIEVTIGSVTLFLSHYAHRVWHHNNRGVIHFYGHSHGNLPSFGKSLDVGIDNIKKLLGEYRPINLREGKELVAALPLECPDHHKERSEEVEEQ